MNKLDPITSFILDDTRRNFFPSRLFRSRVGGEGEEGFIDWSWGTTEVAISSVIFAIGGLMLLLSKQELLTQGAVSFYIFLYIIGFFGHIDDISKDSFKKFQDPSYKDKSLASIGLGLLGWLVIQMTFLIGLSLLATQEGSLSMNKWELLMFNLTFVIAGEELVFRDTIPFYLSSVLNIGLKNEVLSVTIAFVVSSVIFGSLHIWTYGFELIAVTKAIISGIILSVIRIFGGLFASYIAHMLYNSVNIMGLFILPI